jgi:uncharacterized membrane protein (UPF0127 family)
VGTAGKVEMQRATVLFPRVHASVLAEVARTPTEIEAGLRPRLFLPESEGMLFVLPRREQARFTMTGMSFGLDLVVVDCGRVIEIFDSLDPGERSVVSFQPATEVLEVARGWASRHGVAPGDVVSVIP